MLLHQSFLFALSGFLLKDKEILVNYAMWKRQEREFYGSTGKSNIVHLIDACKRITYGLVPIHIYLVS